MGLHPLESSEFPDGLGVDRNDNLVIYAAGEEHEGTYEATVTFPETGKVIKLQTHITVEPWSPPLKIEVPLGQAGENFEEAKDVEPPQPTDENAFIYYVSGFTPDSVHCENPKWILVDNIRNTTTDITEKGIALSTSQMDPRYVSANVYNYVCFLFSYSQSGKCYEIHY